MNFYYKIDISSGFVGSANTQKRKHSLYKIYTTAKKNSLQNNCIHFHRTTDLSDGLGGKCFRLNMPRANLTEKRGFEVPVTMISGGEKILYCNREKLYPRITPFIFTARLISLSGWVGNASA
jgi:hypothetical protein